MGIELITVMRPQPIGDPEPWLDVQVDGIHVGWLPVGTPTGEAVRQATKWANDNREIAAAARQADKRMGSRAGVFRNV